VIAIFWQKLSDVTANNCGISFGVLKPKMFLKPRIIVCIVFITLLFRFDGTKVRRKPSLKLGRISRRVVHSSLNAFFRVKKRVFLVLGAGNGVVLRRAVPLCIAIFLFLKEK
jgi:hypothetical protein